MIEFTITHDNLIGPNFPYETLKKFSFMTVTTEPLGVFKDLITIKIQKEKENISQEEIYRTIFSLGKLVGQTMYMKY